MSLLVIFESGDGLLITPGDGPETIEDEECVNLVIEDEECVNFVIEDSEDFEQ